VAPAVASLARAMTGRLKAFGYRKEHDRYTHLNDSNGLDCIPTVFTV